MTDTRIEAPTPRATGTLAITSPTPLRKRDRHWRRHAKNTTWTVDGDAISYTGRKRHDTFRVEIGDEPGQAHNLTLVRGYIITSAGAFVADHYVLVDVDGTPVSPAVRRAHPAPDQDPEAAWWPIGFMQKFCAQAKIPLRHDTARSAADLTDRYPGVFDTELGG